jgi:hypothetical protein
MAATNAIVSLFIDISLLALLVSHPRIYVLNTRRAVGGDSLFEVNVRSPIAEQIEPVKLRDVCELVGMHESTITRVCSAVMP